MNKIRIHGLLYNTFELDDKFKLKSSNSSKGMQYFKTQLMILKETPLPMFNDYVYDLQQQHVTAIKAHIVYNGKKTAWNKSLIFSHPLYDGEVMFFKGIRGLLGREPKLKDLKNVHGTLVYYKNMFIKLSISKHIDSENTVITYETLCKPIFKIGSNWNVKDVLPGYKEIKTPAGTLALNVVRSNRRKK